MPPQQQHEGGGDERRAESRESVLGKRSAGAEAGAHSEEEAWFPSACLPFCPFGEPGEVERRAKMMRTTLLFSALEHEVKAEREAARLAQRARWFRELRVSAELAARFPMRVTDDEEGAGDEVGAAPSSFHEARLVVDNAPTAAELSPACEAASEQAGACEEVCAEKSAARRSREPTLPRPLTHKGLQDAFAELPAGAVNTIQSCLQCWSEGRLDSSDVTETVRSFAAKSEAIRSLFAAATGKEAIPPLLRGETATDQDLIEILRV